MNSFSKKIAILVAIGALSNLALVSLFFLEDAVIYADGLIKDNAIIMISILALFTLSGIIALTFFYVRDLEKCKEKAEKLDLLIQKYELPLQKQKQNRNQKDWMAAMIREAAKPVESSDDDPRKKI